MWLSIIASRRNVQGKFLKNLARAEKRRHHRRALGWHPGFFNP
jgi:hypothetical protein